MCLSHGCHMVVDLSFLSSLGYILTNAIVLVNANEKYLKYPKNNGFQYMPTTPVLLLFTSVFAIVSVIGIIGGFAESEALSAAAFLAQEGADGTSTASNRTAFFFFFFSCILSSAFFNS